MRVRLGFEIAVEVPAAMPLVLSLDIRDEALGCLDQRSDLFATPNLPSQLFRDLFGNTRRRIHAPQGCLTLIFDAVADLPELDLMEGQPRRTPMSSYLGTSPLCDVQALQPGTQELMGGLAQDRAGVEAICAYVRARKAAEAGPPGGEAALHQAIAWCRAAGIPARFVRGFGGVPAAQGFSTWFEAFLDGRWLPFDIDTGALPGRLALARGRDAADVPLVDAPGPFRLRGHKVWFFRQDAGSQPGPGTRRAPPEEGLRRAA